MADNFFKNWFRMNREVTPGVPSTTDPNAASNKPTETSGNWEANVTRPYGRQSLLVLV